MKYFSILLIITLLLITQYGNSQHYLNLVTDHGGPTGQSKSYVCMADSQFIYTIGDFTDSAQSNIWPYFAKFDYRGNMIFQDTLGEIESDKKIWMRKLKPVHKSGSHYYFAGLRYDTEGIHNYLIELDASNGQIVRSSTTQMYSTDPNKNYGLIDFIHYNKNNTLTIVTYDGSGTRDSTKKYVQIIEMDTNLIITKHLVLYDTSFYPQYINKLSNGNYEIIGVHSSRFNDQTPIIHLLIDSLGNRLDYDVHDFDGETFFGTDAETYTVARNDNHDFIITFVHDKEVKVGMGKTKNSFPYVMCYSQDFDTLRWETPFLRPHNYARPRIDIESMCKAFDDSGFVTAGHLSYRVTYTYGKALAFKVSPEGDSLWARTYISSAYDVADSILYWFVKQIIPTPYGYAMTGDIFDWPLYKTRSFLLHIDHDGCLIPGCDDTVNTADIKEGKEKPFVIYPNPVGDQMYILSRISSQDRHAIIFYDMNGREVHKSYIVPDIGGQYIVFLPSSFVTGMYVMNIVDGDGKVVFSEKVVKE